MGALLEGGLTLHIGQKIRLGRKEGGWETDCFGPKKKRKVSHIPMKQAEGGVGRGEEGGNSHFLLYNGGSNEVLL